MHHNSMLQRMKSIATLGFGKDLNFLSVPSRIGGPGWGPHAARIGIGRMGRMGFGALPQAGFAITSSS